MACSCQKTRWRWRRRGLVDGDAASRALWRYSCVSSGQERAPGNAVSRRAIGGGGIEVAIEAAAREGWREMLMLKRLGHTEQNVAWRL